MTVLLSKERGLKKYHKMGKISAYTNSASLATFSKVQTFIVKITVV